MTKQIAPSRPVLRERTTRPGAGERGESADVADSERDPLVGTLARGLAVLDAVLAAPLPLSLAEVAALTNLEQSTTLRLLRALEDNAYVVRNSAARTYGPSPKALHPLALLHPIDRIRRESGEAIRALADELRQTVVLIVYVGHERLVVEIAQVAGSLSPFYGTWLRGPLHGTGGGKSLLLDMKPAERDALVGTGALEAFTPHTLTTRAALDADLALSAQRGYVVARDEQRVGITAIGCPVKTWTGAVVGALVMTALTRDVDIERAAWCGERIRQAAGLLLYQVPSLGAAAQFCGR